MAFIIGQPFSDPDAPALLDRALTKLQAMQQELDELKTQVNNSEKKLLEFEADCLGLWEATPLPDRFVWRGNIIIDIATDIPDHLSKILFTELEVLCTSSLKNFQGLPAGESWAALAEAGNVQQIGNAPTVDALGDS